MSEPVVYSGKTKVKFCERLGREWKKLADYLEIPESDQQGFGPGDEAREVWAWLSRREMLGELPEALQFIGRGDLANLLEPQTTAVMPSRPTWKGCPYPGLLSFKTDEAAIFFGRASETRKLLERFSQPDGRFLAVIGASGSGKSSLVQAGLIPKLQETRAWGWVRMTPGAEEGDPFSALAKALTELHGPGLREGDENVRQLHDRLLRKGGMAGVVGDILAGHPNSQLLIFIDQFEELFTLAAEAHRLPFCILLRRMADTAGLRTVITLRADFYGQCLAYPPLTELLRREQASFPLDQPGPPALLEMITGPAAVAGLSFDDGLVGRILADTGAEPGSLALMAFALHELYKASQPGTRLSFDAYDSFGGVPGAIGQRADAAFDELDADARQAFEIVFKELVDVDAERGVPTRRRVPLDRFEPDGPARRLIARFAEQRLLVCGGREDGLVEVAHEALLTHWSRLQRWIGERFDDLRLLRQVRGEANEWARLDFPKSHLWPQERLRRVHKMMARLSPSLSDDEKAFVRPEAERLLAEIAEAATSHERRAWIGDRLAEIGDPRPGTGLNDKGLPEFDWLPVPGGSVILEGKVGRFKVEPFHISRYLVTWRQYRAFLEAGDGYGEARWWEGLAQRPEAPGSQFRSKDNHPAENVSWYDAMAYCRWLTEKLGDEIRLPTEWEWQQAATGGLPGREYPWQGDWNSDYANTWESNLGRRTAVGLYPRGASPVGCLDMAGNVFEWCLNAYDDPKNVAATGDPRRVVRGGS